MVEFIENLFSNLFGENVILATILIALIPVIELKGAIPFSMSVDIWGANALSILPAFFCGLLGSCLVVPILALIYAPIIKFLKSTKLFRKLALKIEERVNRKKSNIDKKVEEEFSSQNKTTDKKVDAKKYNKSFWIKLISVFMFVAIPLPLTGVWTGTCIAVCLGLNFWWTCLSVITGNIVAGVIITFVSSLFGDSTIIFVLILFALIILFLLVGFISKLIKKRKNKQQNNQHVQIDNNNQNSEINNNKIDA